MSSGFVSEADLVEKRRVQRENWQKTKGENDPEEPPEEEVLLVDRRTLFEKLQEQRDKKQEEWEEAHKLKNMVRGLEDDEIGFLDLVDETKLREENRIKKEEKSALEEYRQKVAERQIKSSRAAINSEIDVVKKYDENSLKNRRSQMSLLAGAIKRKRNEDDDDSNKKVKYTKTESNLEDSRKCIAILPGIGEYTDSSDTDSESCSSSESSTAKDITGRIITEPSCS